MRFHYGYFVLLPNGHPMPSGDDWGPTPNTYKPGDSMGIENGKEVIVVGVAKVGAARRQGFDVLVLVVEYDQRDPVRWAPSSEVVDAALRALMTQPTPPPTIQTEWKEKNVRMVAIWNRLYPRPSSETFHEFLVEIPLTGTFGRAWYKSEIAKPENERHVVEQWLRVFPEEGRKNRPAHHQPGQVYVGRQPARPDRIRREFRLGNRPLVVLTRKPEPHEPMPGITTEEDVKRMEQERIENIQSLTLLSKEQFAGRCREEWP